jgi:hypothetical protein
MTRSQLRFSNHEILTMERFAHGCSIEEWLVHRLQFSDATTNAHAVHHYVATGSDWWFRDNHGASCSNATRPSDTSGTYDRFGICGFDDHRCNENSCGRG